MRLPLSSFLSLSLPLLSLAAPSPLPGSSLPDHSKRSLSVPLYRRSAPSSSGLATRDGGLKKRSGRDLVNWAGGVSQNVHLKYGKGWPPEGTSNAKKMKRYLSNQHDGMVKRQGNSSSSNNAPVQLFNIGPDSEWVGTVSVGTPAQDFVVIMDTGSADFWLASSDCTTGCSSSTPTFQSSSSSSLDESSTPFQVQYGSGAAAGQLVRDDISMGGIRLSGDNSDQVFGLCDQVSGGLLDGPVSGLMGLAFESIASSRSKPWWQAVADDGGFEEDVMMFALTRFINETSNSGQNQIFPGGVMTLGTTNTSLFTGEMNYIDLVDDGSFWLIPLSGASVNNNAVSSFSTQSAAIDTGTSLIGGPPDLVSQIYSQIPNSQLSNDASLSGHYEFPCDTDVTVQLSFGEGDNAQTYTIDPEDFNLGRVTRNTCLGGIFEVQAQQGTPAWIVGDVFLKNVVSAFHYRNPRAVGFATPNQDTLRALANNDDAVGAVESIGGGPVATGTAGGGGRGQDSGAMSMKMGMGMGVATAMLGGIAMGMGLVGGI